MAVARQAHLLAELGPDHPDVAVDVDRVAAHRHDEQLDAVHHLVGPHDVPTLIKLRGGDAAFVKWLDELFDGGHFAMRNEPGFLIPYLYIHAGRHDRTADVAPPAPLVSIVPLPEAPTPEDDP